MTAELSSELVETDGLRESLAEIFASHEEFEKFFSGVFSELNTLSAELVRCQQAWTSERSRTETELEERAARLEADRAALAAEREQAWEEISQRRREAEQGLVAASGDESLKRMFEEAEQERTQLNQERSVLESELDMVRNRAAEMSETLAQQQREMAEERQRWSAELKRMRRVLEALSTRQVEFQEPSIPSGNTGGTAAPADRPSEPAPASPAESDPVLGSVMAQFEMLQKDIVRRRKDAAKSK